MSLTTPINNLRYATLTDPPNALTGFQQLAEDADTRMIPRFASTGARDAAIVSPTEGMYCDVAGVGLLRYSGSTWVEATPSGAPQIVVKPSVTSRASTTTAIADPHLFLSYTVGNTYLATAMIVHSAGNNTADIKVGFIFSGSETHTIGHFGLVTAVTTSSGDMQTSTGTSTSTGGAVAFGTSTAGGVTSLSATWTAGNTGSIFVSWAQNTSDASATNVLAGSWLKLEQV